MDEKRGTESGDRLLGRNRDEEGGIYFSEREEIEGVFLPLRWIELEVLRDRL